LRQNEFRRSAAVLDPRDPGRWPLAVRGFFVALIFAVFAAFAWYILVWNDDRPVLQKAEADELDLRSQFENKQQRAANLDAYKAQLAEMERSFGAMLRQLPGKTEVPNLAGRYFANRALPPGFRKNCFSPAPRKATASTRSCRSGSSWWAPIIEFGAFVSGIAALPRIVTLHDIQITPVTTRPAALTP
jgi:type IV pilus assembly protein PilO